MEFLNESYPFLLGVVVAPLFLAIGMVRSRLLWGALTLVPAVALGACVSALNGELAAGMPEGLFAVAADSMLVYGGALVANYIVWKRVLARGAQGALWRGREPRA